jgi:hypothetical protein
MPVCPCDDDQPNRVVEFVAHIRLRDEYFGGAEEEVDLITEDLANDYDVLSVDIEVVSDTDPTGIRHFTGMESN